WNLTALLSARQRKLIAESRLRQAELNYEDLRGKLAAGVQEAKDDIQAAREQIGRSTQELRHASASYRESERLLKERPGTTIGSVLQAIQGLQAAHSGYLGAVTTHNKAQVRLLLLLGPGPDHHDHDHPGACVPHQLP